MTRKEALNAVVSLPDVSDFELEKALMDNDVVNINEVYSKVDAKSIDMAAIDILTNRYNITSQSEGGFSIGYSLEGLKAKIQALAKKHDLVDIIASFNGQPKIKDITNMW